MHKLYCFHIKLTETSEWTIELGHSLAEVMAHIASYDVEPYAWFKTNY